MVPRNSGRYKHAISPLSNNLTAFHGTVWITQWVDEAVREIGEIGLEYRRRLSEKTGMTTATDRSHDGLINLKGLQGASSFLQEERI